MDVLSRWEAGRLSMLEAGELLGMSERQFRRYRDRYEEEGLAGLARSPARQALVEAGAGGGSPHGCWRFIGRLIGAGT